MAGTFHVNTESVQRGANQFRTAKSEFDGKLRQLQGIMSQLETDFKTSQAAPAFQESYRKWNTGAKGVTEALEGMSKFLNAVVTGTTQYDKDMARAARGGGGSRAV